MTLEIINQGECGPGLLNNWLKDNDTVLYFKHEFLNTLQLLLLSSIQVKRKHCSAELKYMQPIFSSKLILYFRVYPENSRFSLSRPPQWGVLRAWPLGADPCVTWERESDSKLRVNVNILLIKTEGRTIGSRLWPIICLPIDESANLF